MRCFGLAARRPSAVVPLLLGACLLVSSAVVPAAAGGSRWGLHDRHGDGHFDDFDGFKDSADCDKRPPPAASSLSTPAAASPPPSTPPPSSPPPSTPPPSSPPPSTPPPSTPPPSTPPPPASSANSVAGVEILDPKQEVCVYQQAQIDYWRTVFAQPESTTSLNPNTSSLTGKFKKDVCPSFENGINGETTYLITSSLTIPGIPNPLMRDCDIPAGKPVIVNVFNDFEFFSPPLDSGLFLGFGSGVRLTDESLLSLAQVTAQRLRVASCLTASIDGVDVPDLASFFHVASVNDMDIGPALYTNIRDIFGVDAPGAADLYQNGFNNTDFADAGYYLVLPKGFPEQRPYTLTLGIKQGCTLSPGQWWARGAATAGEECKRCWPNAASCQGEIRNLPGDAVPSALFQYTIYVQ